MYFVSSKTARRTLGAFEYQGLSLSFRWVVFDENLNGLTEAFPLRINL